MERRDYLLTQIQQLARFIQLLIEKLLGKTSSLNVEEVMDHQREEFREKCGFDITLMATPVFEELKEALNADAHFNTDIIQLLADYMALLADKMIDSPPSLLYRIRSNALKLYELAEVTEKTYSLERQKKMAELRKNLE